MVYLDSAQVDDTGGLQFSISIAYYVKLPREEIEYQKLHEPKKNAPKKRFFYQKTR